jgi:NADH-quinone oxidoreductase subunit G
MTDTAVKNILYIDGQEVEFSDEKNLLEVIRKTGIEVPTFCYRPDLSTYGACRMCVVEIEGRGIQTSCTMKPEAGMKVKVNTDKTRRIRRMSVELLLASHNRDCTTCSKSNNCDLQDLSKKLGVREVRFESAPHDLPIDNSNPSIVRDPNKCILCGACTRACKEIQGQGVLEFVGRGSKTIVSPAYKKNLNEVDCVYCGQCSAVCPTGALTIKSDVDNVWNLLMDENLKVVTQIAPAVRVALGEAFGLPAGENSIGLITAALKKIGFDAVFDTTFTADLTIMEEATEFLSRVQKGENLPLFTSCCPAWVRFAEQRYPQLLKNLSTCKSPQQMFGSIARKILKEEFKVDEKNIAVVSIMPCTAKKAEANRSEFSAEGQKEVDLVLTTQELIRMIKEAGIDFNNIQPESIDSPFGMITGAGVIFGASGGVMEAAVRTAYEVMTGKKLEKYNITQARGLETIKEITLDIEGTEVKLAVVNTLKEAEALVERILAGEANYHMIEVMACPGGCIAGAGQPSYYKDNTTREKRMKGLYKADTLLPLHKSHDNPQIKEIYGNWLQKPNSHTAHEVLHTHYKNRKRIMGETIDIISTDGSQKTTDVSVCVGTCCYAKGSYNIIEDLAELIKKNNMQNKVSVKATFCVENCSNGPSILVNDELIADTSSMTAADIFKKYIQK